ncbi:propanediol dehydratase large subunit [Klebsiella pneumoniae]|uniref:Propanediol dehydratase large subunit n=1 Tax=Klebsiella pneumoniae TaxID=573 RepID=A0A377VWT4_KLEPN|nr:propanediol dehydratase large subunit [Klebsiella pneumoniae]
MPKTISVYGTEPVFTDGDDTPWSKGFLASSYASRGLKMRFTSGSGSEVQMGYAEGKSMLYLEARCIYITKAAGVQGLQNGSVSLYRRTVRRAVRDPRRTGGKPDLLSAGSGVCLQQRSNLYPLGYAGVPRVC